MVSAATAGACLSGYFFFFSSRRRHTRCLSDWSSDVCSSDLIDRLDSPSEFWQLLIEGVEAIDTLSAEELVQAGVDSAMIADRHYVRKAPRLADKIGRASCRERV